MREDAARRPLPALVALVALLGLAGCASGRGEGDLDVRAEEELLVEARSRLAAGELGRAEDAAETLLERTKDPARKQEALFLAGEARFADGELVKAFRHYQALLHDFAYSPFVPRIEEHVYAIGAEYLSREPWPVFGDLFSGRERGAEVMREFAASFPSSSRADDALAMLAAYHYSRKQYPEAAARYADVARRHPDSEWADLATFRRAECWRLESRGAAYDTTPLQHAARNYRRYLSERPNGAFRERAHAAAREVDELLAESEILKAELYVARNQPRGARIHFANVALAFPETKAAERARAELASRDWDLSLNSIDTLALSPSAEEEE